MQEAVAKLLMGKEGSSGILPVSIPKIAKRGSGIIVEPKPWMSPEEIAKPATELIRIRSSEINADVSKIKKLLNEAVADTAFPGGVMLAAKDGQIFLHESFGFHTYRANKPTKRGNIFDLASITKTISTTSAVMNLVEENKLSLNDKVIKYLSLIHI